MGSVAVSQVKIPGIGGQINANQITQVKKIFTDSKSKGATRNSKNIYK